MVCSLCNGVISKDEFDYSIKNFGELLCRSCQKNNNSLKQKYQKKKEKLTYEEITLYETLIKIRIPAKLEQWDGYKHIDIAIPEVKVNIEVDGMQHAYNQKQALSDLKRTFYSLKKGYVTIRIPNKLIQEDLYKTVGYLKKLIYSRAEQLKIEENY